MGNFERLSVLVIVVIIVMIVVIALVQLTGGDEATTPTATDGPSATSTVASVDPSTSISVPAPRADRDSRALVVPGVRPSNPLMDQLVPGARPLALSETPAAPPPDVVRPEPPKPVEDKVHVVQSGETIGKIAKTYYPSNPRAVDAIVKANPAVDPARMRIGTKLTIPGLGTTTASTASTETSSTSSTTPVAAKTSSSGSSGGSLAGGTYVVRKGDTLATISRRAYGNTARWQDIWLANYDAIGDDVDAPTAGTRLTLPR